MIFFGVDILLGINSEFFYLAETSCTGDTSMWEGTIFHGESNGIYLWIIQALFTSKTIEIVRLCSYFCDFRYLRVRHIYLTHEAYFLYLFHAFMLNFLLENTLNFIENKIVWKFPLKSEYFCTVLPAAPRGVGVTSLGRQTPLGVRDTLSCRVL